MGQLMFLRPYFQASTAYLPPHLNLPNNHPHVHSPPHFAPACSPSTLNFFRVMSPTVLDVGYNWNHPKIIEAGFDPHSIRLRIAAGPQTMAMFGYEMDGFFVEPLDDVDAESDDYDLTIAGKQRFNRLSSQYYDSSGSDPDSCDGASAADTFTNRIVDISSEQYIASNIKRYIEKLRSREYEAVMIEYSIRMGTDKAETVLFERLVNATREFAPRAKLAFNWNLGSTLDAFKRVTPVPV